MNEKKDCAWCSGYGFVEGRAAGSIAKCPLCRGTGEINKNDAITLVAVGGERVERVAV